MGTASKDMLRKSLQSQRCKDLSLIVLYQPKMEEGSRTVDGQRVSRHFHNHDMPECSVSTQSYIASIITANAVGWLLPCKMYQLLSDTLAKVHTTAFRVV